MNRRHFLRQATSSLVLPVSLNGFGARIFTRPSPFLGALMGLDATDRILVVVQMQGGNDGLNTVIPLDQMSVYAAPTFRGNIAIPESRALRLADRPDVGLHPALAGFHQLYGEGKLSIVQGVSYAAPSFSHFRASDIWMTAVDSSQSSTSGWAGRYLDRQFPGFPTGYPNDAMPDPPAIQIGYVTATTLLGPNRSMATVLQDPDTFARLVGDKPNDPVGDPSGYAGQQLAFIRQQQTSAVSYAAQIQAAASRAANQAAYPDTELAQELKIVARLIAGGLKTRVYYVTLGGFDTHANQVYADTTTGPHATLLATLSEAITAFQRDLEQLGVADRVAGMTFSEFGRRAISNGSRGTDHGTSAPMFVFGNAVQTGVIGTNPALSNLDERNNLRMQHDFRQVYAAVLEDWFGADAATESAALFRDFQSLPVFRSGGVNREAAPADTRVFPVPAVGSFTLRSPALADGLDGWRFVDATGRVLPVATSRPDDHSLRIDVSAVPPGTYLLHVQTPREAIVRRVLVSR